MSSYEGLFVPDIMKTDTLSDTGAYQCLKLHKLTEMKFIAKFAVLS